MHTGVISLRRGTLQTLEKDDMGLDQGTLHGTQVQASTQAAAGASTTVEESAKAGCAIAAAAQQLQGARCSEGGTLRTPSQESAGTLYDKR